MQHGRVAAPGMRHLKEAVNRGLERSVRLAVTGLSHSGKSTHITALLHHLLHGVDTTSLPFFSPAREARLLGVRRVEHLNLDIAGFPYEAALAALSEARGRRDCRNVSASLKVSGSAGPRPGRDKSGIDYRETGRRGFGYFSVGADRPARPLGRPFRRKVADAGRRFRASRCHCLSG